MAVFLQFFVIKFIFSLSGIFFWFSISIIFFSSTCPKRTCSCHSKKIFLSIFNSNGKKRLIVGMMAQIVLMAPPR